MKITGIVTILIIYLLNSGCSTSGELPYHEQQGEESEERFEPPPGSGNLYIVRKTSLLSASIVSLKVNSQYIGQIEQSNYHLLELAPGEYTISATTGKREAETTVSVVAGKNHFVQIEPGVHYKSEFVVEQIDAAKGREMVSLGFRLATLPVELKRELSQKDVLEMSAADLAKGYLAASTSLRLAGRHVDAGVFGGSGAKFILKIRGETVDKDNVNEYLAKYQKQLSWYEREINQRGYMKIAGAYKGEATKSCAASNSLWAAMIQQKAQTGVEIRQEGVDVQIMISFKQDDKEKTIGNWAAIAETAIALTEPTNSDYFFLGEVKDQVIVLKPDVSVLKTWPKWASPPSRSNLENCKVTLTRL